jgi:heme A synthase
MTQKGKPIKFYILFFLGMFVVIYLLKYAANSRDLTAGHFVAGFLNTLFLLITLTYSYYLSDRRSTLPKEEFKEIRKKSMLIVFFSAWTIALGISIIGNILLHTEIRWMKLIEISLGLSAISILLAIVMTKLVPIKITPKTSNSRGNKL